MLTRDDMKAIIYHPKATSDKLKYDVLMTALGGEDKAADELKRFLKLVMKNRRTKFLHLMLLTGRKFSTLLSISVTVSASESTSSIVSM